jgi:hypothetical protein
MAPFQEVFGYRNYQHPKSAPISQIRLQGSEKDEVLDV